jgi:hypothetical protein
MTFLFWTCWILDVLLLVLSAGGKSFRAGFGAGTDINGWVMFACAVIVVVSLFLRVAGHPKVAVIIAGIPVAALAILYVLEGRAGG